LRSCVDTAVNDFGSWGKHGRCCECGSWRRRGRCGAWWVSRRMHGPCRECGKTVCRAVIPAMCAAKRIKMRLGKFGSCLGFRHAGWRDGPIVMATARMEIMRTVTAITLLKKRSPGHLRPGPISTPASAVLLRGQTTVVSDALCRFLNANDAPPPNAENVTESRKSC
jgi:hypothetical protein